MMNRRKFISMLLASAALGSVSAFPLSRKALAQPVEKDCVIIGGGVSGFTAAYLLRDRNVLLLEAESGFGGRTISGIHNDWYYPEGTEYLGKPDGVLAEIIENLNLDLIEIPSPMDQIWRDGKFYSGGSGRIKMLTRKGGVNAFNRFLKALKDVAAHYEEVPDYDPNGELARLDEITCKQWFDELRLPDVYAETYNVTFRGLFGANIDEVSALGAFAEIFFDFEGMDHPLDQEDIDEIIRDKDSEGSGSYSFRHGIAEVIEALAKFMGDRAQHSSRVISVTGNDEDGYEVVYQHEGVEKTVGAQSVIFSTPMPVTKAIGAQLLPLNQQSLMNLVPYAQFVTAAIFSDEPIYTDAFDLAVPDGWFVTDVYDCTWMQKKLGEKHKGYVASMYIGPHTYKDTSLVGMSDADLLENSYKDLQNIWPDIRDKVKGYDIHRFEYAYPVMTPGAYGRLTKLWSMFNGGVQIAGDGMIYPTFEAAVQAGTIAARRINEWL
ncbi:FAD-dependent oxidoreductase [Pseudodesulfovibrio sp. zrk46]|uniref:flavin monoamine oxidase family protein n=1 Tax=Pseudodesulfovibrio sp. zrk46 TaxID=2725288 RepID=UPI00144A0ADC|nr:FAD-dependent oxidoreductase [Pseudodesulfovibrio sp. zrk46]QJB55973.1 FAD-dependent oxidoreductase [Pseudodesulfovibrio sp. zrk46]